MKRKVQSASTDKVIVSDRFRMAGDVLLFAIELKPNRRARERPLDWPAAENHQTFELQWRQGHLSRFGVKSCSSNKHESILFLNYYKLNVEDLWQRFEYFSSLAIYSNYCVKGIVHPKMKIL